MGKVKRNDGEDLRQKGSVMWVCNGLNCSLRPETVDIQGYCLSNNYFQAERVHYS